MQQGEITRSEIPLSPELPGFWTLDEWRNFNAFIALVVAENVADQGKTGFGLEWSGL